ncbi:uncharacterized protein LOC111357890 isoform X2 [Spodoptera litura]|uniref:Uncharacterized protein LOC111357890 isoform X2 n=1 Tax=Spodoptera litura TaxID=69820 RepID=A0A9J7ECF1_SPOLT|nr:uncharacterized protein LOC111357890 isoform X2 [Spodoptera litura]
MSKRWYRSRRNHFIIIVITTICIIYYISDSWQRGLNMDLTRRTEKPADPISVVVPSKIVLKGHRLIESQIKESLQQDKGQGCNVPQLDPFAEELVAFERKKRPSIICNDPDWVKCYISKCWVVKDILETTTDLVCTYQDILYQSDWKYHLGPVRTIQNDGFFTLDKSDHIKIKCTGKRGDSNSDTTWFGYHVGFRKSVERLPTPPGREDTYNVMIFGFDSTSKLGILRNLPKSFDHIKNHLKATVLDAYNIVGDGTPAALFPILSGKTELELPDVRKASSNATLDSFPFLFYKLKEDGYRTAYFEDMPGIGTFQYRFNGFKRQPADHYLRSFYLEMTKRGKWLKQHPYCVGDTPQYKVMMNITEQFMQLDGKRFGFTFVADITHDASYISLADNDFLLFLRRLEEKGHLEDTLVILMTDHGPRYSTVRGTVQGRLEERLAFMAVRLPDRMRRSQPYAQMNLEQNAAVLTTPHDVYATIVDVLKLPQHKNPYKIPGADFPRGMSLIEPIPKNRSCSEAGIQPHWCACVNWKNVTDSSMIQRTAEAFVNYINQLTEPQRSLCVPRTLKEIKWVMVQALNKGVLSFVSAKDIDGYLGKFGKAIRVSKQTYQVQVAVGPGYGVYEASMTYLVNEDKFIMDSRDISRTNVYGDEPKCISATHPHLNMYCYCKK